MRYFFIFSLIFCLSSTLFAQNPTPTVQQWQFHLATADGKKFINSRHIQQPLLVNFWSVECPPCVKELPMLQQFAQQNPHWQVLLINTDQDRQHAEQFLKKHKIQLPNLKISNDANVFMRKAGNHLGGLPYTLALKSGHSKNVCGQHLGALNLQHLQQFKQHCTHSSNQNLSNK